MRITRIVACSLFLAGVVAANEMTVWLGTGGPNALGIYRTTLDPASGKLTPPVLAAEIAAPGFLTLSPEGRFLYSLAGTDGGSVAAFRIGENQSLELINTVVTGDGGASHLALDRTGKILFSAQYGGGSVSSYAVNDDGSIGKRTALIEHEGSGPNEDRQKGPHPHWVGTDPDNRFLFVPDLGADKIVIYRIDHEKKSIAPHGHGTAVPGGGPRHMKFSSDAKFAYVLNELLLSVTVFAYDAEGGTLNPIQTIETLAESEQEVPNKASEIRIHPNGKFVYAANRGHDSIAVFSRDAQTGKLTFVELESIRGCWPRNFNIDPSGKWLIAGGRYSNTLSVFLVDDQTGNLIFSGNIENCPSPICIAFE